MWLLAPENCSRRMPRINFTTDYAAEPQTPIIAGVHGYQWLARVALGLQQLLCREAATHVATSGGYTAEATERPEVSRKCRTAPTSPMIHPIG